MSNYKRTAPGSGKAKPKSRAKAKKKNKPAKMAKPVKRGGNKTGRLGGI